MSRERPILFSAPMVRAILDGCKTATRRIVKPPVDSEINPVEIDGYWQWATKDSRCRCPYQRRISREAAPRRVFQRKRRKVQR